MAVGAPECPPACLSTFVAIGQQDAGHEALLAVGAEGVPDEDLVCCQQLLQQQWVPPVKLRPRSWAGLEGVGLCSALSTRPPRPPLPQNPQPHPSTNVAANRTGKVVFLGKLTASGPLALATALPPRLGSPHILGQNPSGTDRQLDEGTVGRGAQTHGATRGPYAWPIDSGSSRLSLQT